MTITIKRKLYPVWDRFIVYFDDVKTYNFCINKYLCRSYTIKYITHRFTSKYPEATRRDITIVVRLVQELLQTNMVENYQRVSY